MDCGCTSSVSAAQAESLQIKIQVAVAKKQQDAMKLQGQAIVELLQAAAGSPPSDRPTQLDVTA
jgi:hypothetical protein